MIQSMEEPWRTALGCGDTEKYSDIWKKFTREVQATTKIQKYQTGWPEISGSKLP